jgi:hypothetical protein
LNLIYCAIKYVHILWAIVIYTHRASEFIPSLKYRIKNSFINILVLIIQKGLILPLLNCFKLTVIAYEMIFNFGDKKDFKMYFCEILELPIFKNSDATYIY